MIAHHEHPTRFADISISVPAMSSTCELLYRIFMLIGRDSDINRHAAEDLYTGMCTDTGQFTYNSNDPEIFEIVAALMRKGIDKDRIIRNIYSQNTLDRYRLQGYVLAHKLVVDGHAARRLFRPHEGRTGPVQLPQGRRRGVGQHPPHDQGREGQHLAQGRHGETADQRLHPQPRRHSANEMARRYFNGGGHFNAAGGRLSCSLDEAIRIAQEALEAYRPQLTAEAPQPEA
jgi:phosphoesterase RecJ-like protein